MGVEKSNTITEMLRSNCVSAREHYNTTTQCTLLLKGGEEKATLDTQKCKGGT